MSVPAEDSDKEDEKSEIDSSTKSSIGSRTWIIAVVVAALILKFFYEILDL